jgi:ectoine hydroxylase-related dioxygenase (phytanoyl-CoA dioxygenase family)
VQDPGLVNQWVNMLLNKGAVFRTVLQHPTIDAVAEHVLGKEFVLSELSAHITRPGNSLLPLHTDQWWMPVPRLPEEDFVRASDISRTNIVIGPPRKSTTPINPPMVMNAMCMMSAFTEENGGTRLVPMSHLSGVQPDQEVPHTVPSVAAEGPAGTVVIWEGRTWHSAGENRSNADRFGLVSYYGAAQARQLANLTYGTKAHVLDGATDDFLRLLGFKVWRGYGRTGGHGEDIAIPAEELIGELRPKGSA